MTAVDTNVLSALLTGTEKSSARAVALLSAETALLVSPVVYAELAGHPKGDEVSLKALLNALRIDVDWTLTAVTWQLAAKRYRDYAGRRRKSRGGHPKRLLADFIVGAHATRAARRLLSFDKRIYHAAFPELEVIS